MHETPAILIVDSNAGFAMMLKESLEQGGLYRATVTHTGEDALAIASREPFDLAIVDLGINAVDDLDGETVARRLRQEQPNLRLMLIPLEGEMLREGLDDLDIQGVLPKPFFLPDLPDLLRAALTKPLEASQEPVESATPREEGVQDAVAVEPPAPSPQPSGQVIRELEALAREINADAVLVTHGDDVLGSVGRLRATDLDALARIVSQSCRLSQRAARMLGREQRRVELSVEGDEHMLYSLTVVEDILLSAALRPDVTLGLLRHQAKATAKRLQTLLAGY